jgi:cell division protein ZapA (FtsZ GTPase activity inhibitor)
MAKTDLRIETLGTSFTIAADEDPAYLMDLLDRYRGMVEKTRQSTGLKDPLKTAILTGFLLCDELQKARKKEAEERGVRAGESREAQELALGMIARLDEVLEYDA